MKHLRYNEVVQHPETGSTTSIIAITGNILMR